jgi:F-type H+-transporting ATPase subunit c
LIVAADGVKHHRSFFKYKEMVPVNRIAMLLLVVCGLMLVAVSPAMAAEGGADAEAAVAAPTDSLIFTKYFGVGLTVVGAAYGIGKLAASAYDGMSRQPEVAGNIQTAMIIAAALIEGFTFFALLICMLF